MITLRCDRCGADVTGILRLNPVRVSVTLQSEVQVAVSKDFCSSCYKDYLEFTGQIWEQRRKDAPVFDRT